MLGRRTVVSLASMAVTYLFYRLLGRRPTVSLRHSILKVALIAAPAAISYSTVNWLAFEHSDTAHKKTAVSGPPPSAGEPMTIVTAKGTRITIPPTLAPPETVKMPVGLSDREEDDMTPVQMIADNAANGYFFFVAWAALYLALCYAVEVGALERRAAGLRAAAQAAELRALRYQVNPHFLFNTLNSLSSLVLAGRRDQAEKMIINLSTFFRTSLSGDPTEDVALAEEILLQRLYLDIEAVRFPERLIADISIPDQLREACVPGLILQPLVENAVKYGVSRARRPVTVRIRAEEDGGRLVLRVEDDGDPAPVVGPVERGTGVGLRNVRDRLTARFGHEADCRWGPRPGGGFAVTLTMPVVRHGC